MYARLATWENVPAPERAQEISDALRDANLGNIRELPGWQGVLATIDEENRRVTTMMFFDSEENARGADETLRNVSFDDMPEDIRQLMRQSGPPTVTYARVMNRDGL